MKTRASIFFLLIITVFSISAQEIVTADKYLLSVGERYADIKDYEAKIQIKSGSTSMHGTVSHRSPSLLRIDFIDPANQVIVFNGETLTVYLPLYSASLVQTVDNSVRRSSPNIATAQGLVLLRRYYNVAYVTGPDPVPIDTGSAEQVIKLRLTRKSISEGFREIIMDISPDTKLIRRIEGKTLSNTTVWMDFTNTVINQGIPEQRFVYDSPPSANMYNNFLFREAD